MSDSSPPPPPLVTCATFDAGGAPENVSGFPTPHPTHPLAARLFLNRSMASEAVRVKSTEV